MFLKGHMRKIITLAAVLAATAFGALSVGAVNASASFSCSATANHGGEHAPQFTNGGTSINGPSAGGYNCTKGWIATVEAQYESGGTWHQGFNGSGQALQHIHPTSGIFNPNEGHIWTEATQTPVIGGGLLLPCHFNWRYSVELDSADGLNAQQDVSPELFNTC